MNGTVAIVIAGGLVLAASGAGDGDGGHRVRTETVDDTVIVSGEGASARSREDITKEPDPDRRLIEWMQSPACVGDNSEISPLVFWMTYPCVTLPPVNQRPNCGVGQAQEPWWSRTRDNPGAPWGEWRQRSDWYCAAEPLPELTTADFRALPIPPSPLTVQPDRGWVLVNKETIAYSSDDEQTLRTEVLGVGVTVVVTPVSFSWDFGDGHPFTTDGPGSAYPDHDVSRVFRKLGTERVRLTTTWSGRYRINGDSRWRDVDGTATTTSTSPPFEVVERRSVLVDGQ
jgi:hypothetical protein